MSSKHPLKHLLVAALVGGLGLTACGGETKKTDTKASDAKKTEDAKKPEDAKPAPAAMAFKKLDKLPLEIEVPADAEVMDTSVDAPSVNVSSGEMTVMVGTVTEAYPSDFAAAKKSVESDPNKFKSFTKQEEKDGGWHLEFELTSMMDQSPLYGVQIRKVIDGKAYECSRNDRSQAVRDAVAKACQSLRKAG
ncbi:MAG: hypothetical protein JNL82_15755 [Myxococcales bacterium]|nr:hypothetical protein [Myxococcales bacterium]